MQTTENCGFKSFEFTALMVMKIANLFVYFRKLIISRPHICCTELYGFAKRWKMSKMMQVLHIWMIWDLRFLKIIRWIIDKMVQIANTIDRNIDLSIVWVQHVESFHTQYGCKIDKISWDKLKCNGWWNGWYKCTEKFITFLKHMAVHKTFIETYFVNIVNDYQEIFHHHET